MAHPDVIASAFIKLKEVSAALVLSTRQETLPAPFSEWLEYMSRVTKKYPNAKFFPRKETIIQKYNTHDIDFG